MSLLKYESQLREPLVDGDKDYHQITEDIVRPIEMKPSRLWYMVFSLVLACCYLGHTAFIVRLLTVSGSGT